MDRYMRIYVLAAGVFVSVWALNSVAVQGRETHYHPTEAQDWLALAKKGIPDAQYNLGIIYSYADRNLPDAVNWLRRAAKTGYAPAQYQLAEYYALGLGVSKNPAEAKKWYERSANQGLPVAEYYLASVYHFAVGVPHNDERAAKWYRKAAQTGFPGAEVKLGEMYENGAGVPQDYVKAAKWYRRACRRSLDFAIRSTGLFTNGRHKPTGPNVQRFRKEMAHVISLARINLGLLYAHGRGVSQDLVQAYKWFFLADAMGAERAREFMAKLTKTMPPRQIATALKLARNWRPIQE